jgi:hypothetical protein
MTHEADLLAKMSITLSNDERWIVASALSRQIGSYERICTNPDNAISEIERGNIKRTSAILRGVLWRLASWEQKG